MAKAKKAVTKEAPAETKAASDEQIEKAKEVFAAHPHVHTIWFDADKHYRFYETPGAAPVHKADVMETEPDEEDTNDTE